MLYEAQNEIQQSKQEAELKEYFKGAGPYVNIVIC
mgnify:CR=1 FL=1